MCLDYIMIVFLFDSLCDIICVAGVEGFWGCMMKAECHSQGRKTMNSSSVIACRSL